MAFKDQINQNVGFFIYNREFLFFSGIIGSPQAFNRFQIIPACIGDGYVAYIKEGHGR